MQSLVVFGVACSRLHMREEPGNHPHYPTSSQRGNSERKSCSTCVYASVEKDALRSQTVGKLSLSFATTLRNLPRTWATAEAWTHRTRHLASIWRVLLLVCHAGTFHLRSPRAASSVSSCGMTP